ncbi:MAG: glycine betaine--corrinoid protein methyltransferase [Acidobacteriota bacterium]|nr:MAG: glycine betaine--corrinoid protein methyltransferase [Acidobacteriota bacterium]
MEILEHSLVERIIDEALSVLENTGVLVEHDEAFERLVASGFTGNEETRRITFPRTIVEEALDAAPSSLTLYDRDSNPHATLEGDNVHFVPASSALRILDRKTGAIREPNSPDFVDYVKIANGLKHLSYLSTAFIPKDVPQDIADAWRLYMVLSYSKKPVVSGAFTSFGVPRMGEIMSLFRKDKDELARKPLSIFTCCPNTPLRWGEDPISNIIDCAEWGIPIEVVPVLLLGMISPVTTVGALVLHTAEVVSGIAIAQRIRPGTPVLFGGAPASFHMKLMTNPMTAVEALQMYCGYAQIAKHLKLPCQAYMALSDSKFNDSQAGAETGMGAMLAALAGINSVSGPGMLDYVNCFSLEKLAFDDELVAHVHRFTRPVEVKDDLPVQPLIDELVREKHLMMSEHTLEHWPEELYIPGPMVDRTNWEQWEEQGSSKFKERAAEVIDECLEDYDVEPLDPKLHEEIRHLFVSTCEDENVRLPALE